MYMSFGNKLERVSREIERRRNAKGNKITNEWEGTDEGDSRSDASLLNLISLVWYTKQ